MLSIGQRKAAYGAHSYARIRPRCPACKRSATTSPPASACSLPGRWRGRVAPGSARPRRPAGAAAASRGYSRLRSAGSGADPSGRPAHGSCCPACPGRQGLVRSARPLFRAHADRVHDRPGPVDEPTGAEPVKDRLVHPLPQPCSGPLSEAAMRGGSTDPEQRTRQLPPRAAGLGNVHNCSQHRPVVDPASACTVRKLDFGYATCSYSLTSPCSTFRRRTRAAFRSVTSAGSASRSGGRCPRA
jgi:hypothetical protein